MHATPASTTILYWKLLFSVSGLVLIGVLIDFAAFNPQDPERSIAYLLGMVSCGGCIYAGKKLRDAERFTAAIDAQSRRLDRHR
jgi:hypothetical protein